jgi:hypothetical protein
MIPISQKHLCLKHPVNIYRMVTGTPPKSMLQPYRVRWRVIWSPVLGKISSSFSSVFMNCAKRLSALMVHTSKTGKHPPLCAGSTLSTSLLHGWLKTMRVQVVAEGLSSYCCNFLISISGGQWLRASPGLLSAWPYTIKLDEEKSKYAGLAQENGFDSA